MSRADRARRRPHYAQVLAVHTTTGRAGQRTGKTTSLDEFRTRLHGRSIGVGAPRYAHARRQRADGSGRRYVSSSTRKRTFGAYRVRDRAASSSSRPIAHCARRRGRDPGPAALGLKPSQHTQGLRSRRPQHSAHRAARRETTRDAGGVPGATLGATRAPTTTRLRPVPHRRRAPPRQVESGTMWVSVLCGLGEDKTHRGHAASEGGAGARRDGECTGDVDDTHMCCVCSEERAGARSERGGERWHVACGVMRTRSRRGGDDCGSVGVGGWMGTQVETRSTRTRRRTYVGSRGRVRRGASRPRSASDVGASTRATIASARGASCVRRLFVSPVCARQCGLRRRGLHRGLFAPSFNVGQTVLGNGRRPSSPSTRVPGLMHVPLVRLASVARAALTEPQGTHRRRSGACSAYEVSMLARTPLMPGARGTKWDGRVDSSGRDRERGRLSRSYHA